MLELYRGRRAAVLENSALRVTVLEGGGHIAEFFDKETTTNPLWTPIWPSIEPSAYDPAKHPEFGTGTEARLLAGIMGHNLCLDLFGGPSAEEAAAGLSAHGEAPVAKYELAPGRDREHLVMRAALPLAQLHVERTLSVHGRALRVREVVENRSSFDRPVGWTQHVTLGPPFVQRGSTQLRASATRSRVYEHPFGSDDYLKAGADFDWPVAPRADAGRADLRTFNAAPVSSAYTAHLMDRRRPHAFFLAYSPVTRLAFGYIWSTADFPWMGIWEENCSRRHAPWNGQSMTWGLEFGVSPIPESRREMIDRGTLFDEATFRWIPAGSRAEVEYWAVAQTARAIPETLGWPG